MAADSDIPDESLLETCAVIGGNIRRLRKQRGLSIQDLAGHIGLSASYVGLLERGERCPSLKTLFRVGELFETRFEDILSKKADDAPAKQTGKIKSLIGQLQKLSEAELEFVSGVLKGLKGLRG